MSEIHERHLCEPYFSLIKNGEKTVEGRLNKGSNKKVNIGDYFKFYNDNGEEFLVKIYDIKKFPSFKSMLERYIKEALPGIEDINDGIAVYRRFYSEEDENEYSVNAFILSLEC